MEESKISTRTLTIDGMTGDACIAKVTAALKTVPEITDQNVKVGSASFSCDGSHCTQARAAIEAEIERAAQPGEGAGLLVWAISCWEVAMLRPIGSWWPRPGSWRCSYSLATACG
jgi:copper chaperone CopZ